MPDITRLNHLSRGTSSSCHFPLHTQTVLVGPLPQAEKTRQKEPDRCLQFVSWRGIFVSNGNLRGTKVIMVARLSVPNRQLLQRKGKTKQPPFLHNLVLNTPSLSLHSSLPWTIPRWNSLFFLFLYLIYLRFSYFVRFLFSAWWFWTAVLFSFLFLFLIFFVWWMDELC